MTDEFDTDEATFDAEAEPAVTVPKSMLRSVSFSEDDDETQLRVVKMVPVDESEDT